MSALLPDKYVDIQSSTLGIAAKAYEVIASRENQSVTAVFFAVRGAHPHLPYRKFVQALGMLRALRMIDLAGPDFRRLVVLQ